MPRLKIDLRMAMIRPSREVRSYVFEWGTELTSGTQGRKYPSKDKIDGNRLFVL